MKTVRFGRTGVPVSQLCFGTMSFGDQADASEAKNLYAACRKAGVTSVSYTHLRAHET